MNQLKKITFIMGSILLLIGVIWMIAIPLIKPPIDSNIDNTNIPPTVITLDKNSTAKEVQDFIEKSKQRKVKLIEESDQEFLYKFIDSETETIIFNRNSASLFYENVYIPGHITVHS
ncbi:MAG: hypothetical protein RR406_02130 [Bacilli bacterium]